MPSTPPPPPATPNKRRTRSSKDDAPESPTKKAGRKPATGIEHDAKFGYIRANNWTGPEIAEMFKVQKKKEKLKGWLLGEFESAWREGKVDKFNGLLASCPFNSPLHPRSGLRRSPHHSLRLVLLLNLLSIRLACKPGIVSHGTRR